MSAGFSVEELKAQISQSGGLAKANQFMVTLPQLKTYRPDGNELNLMCTAASLPGRQILSQDYQIGTTSRKIANGYAITDLQLTFLVANNHEIRQYFEAWQNEAHDQTDGTVGYFDDYTYDVQIHTIERGLRTSVYKRQLGLTNKVPSIIRNRLPKIGPFDLSQDELDVGVQFKSKKTYTCNLIDCYPTTIDDQQLGNAEEGFMELSVQLSYVDWIGVPGDYTSSGESFGRSALTSLLKRVI
jgi:hypothetical protein